MTRKSRRELERAIDRLGRADGDGRTEEISVVFRDGRGDYYADEGLTEPVEDPDALPGLTVVFGRTVVMRRERAEQEDREILGPAESTPDSVDAVRVARD